MINIWILTWFLTLFDCQPAIELWNWFGQHPFLTVLLIIIFE